MLNMAKLVLHVSMYTDIRSGVLQRNSRAFRASLLHAVFFCVATASPLLQHRPACPVRSTSLLKASEHQQHTQPVGGCQRGRFLSPVITMVLHNPNNWHWVNKDVSPWARQWFEDNLTKLLVQDGDVKAKVSRIQSMDGDVDVSQRKGKVITIFEVKLVLEYTGSAPEVDEVSGTITVPELAHDTDEDEYVFDVDIFSESKEKQPVKDVVRSKLVPLLRKEFQKLAPALIAEHGKDIQHASGSNPSSGFSTPKLHPETSSLKSSQPTSAPTSTSGIVNTITVTDNEEFRTTAKEMYQTFIEPARLAAFTRSPPKLFQGATKGAKFELFGGNVSGEYLELEAPTKLVQSWRLSQWPAGHYSRLQIEFDQNDVDHVTVMRVTWEGVPVGQEEVTKRNWLEYYVKSIKQTFGFGTLL